MGDFGHLDGNLEGLRTEQELLAELNRLRVAAARRRGKVRLSLQDLEAATGVPKSSLASYLSGRTRMPAEVLGRLVIALGVAPAATGAWAAAWERLIGRSLSSSLGGRGSETFPDPTDGRVGHGESRPSRHEPFTELARCTLPRDSAAFVGRRREIEEIVEAVTVAADTGQVMPVYSIDGMPGVGKTTLAVRLAHRLTSRFPDGQLFVNLHAHTADNAPMTPADALAALLAADGLTPQQLPPGLDERTALWRARMAHKRALLVLDNALNSAQVEPLLPNSANSLVLVTSRHRLGDLDAIPLGVEALTDDEGREMFIRLAPRGGADPEAVTELVRLCRHLPLVISLLAGLFRKHRNWTVADLLAEARPQVLTLAAEDRTVAAAFDLSYQHLAPDLQRFLRRLGLHPGADIDPYAAAALGGVPLHRAVEFLQTLYDDNLLDEPAYRRYRMHDLVREYVKALSDDDGSDEQADATGRLFDYYQHVGVLADQHVSRYRRAPGDHSPRAPLAAPNVSDPDRAIAWLRGERANVLACIDQALDTGRHASVVGLTASLAGLFRDDGPWSEGVDRHEAAARSAREMGWAGEEATALTDLGLLCYLTDDYPRATDALRRALEVFVNLGDRLGEANALHFLGEVLHVTGDYQQAARIQQRALTHYRGLGDRRGAAYSLNYLGGVRYSAGDYPGAAEALGEALDLHRDLGNRPGEANGLSNLGAVRLQTGDYEEAVALLQEGLRIHQELGNRLGQANALNNLAEVRVATGDYLAAIDLLDAALDIYREIGDRIGEVGTLNNLGGARQFAGDHDGAAVALDRALEICRQIGSRRHEIEALNHIAALRRASGQPGQGREYHQRALELARSIESPYEEAVSLEGLGRCALAMDDSRGLVFLQQARDIYRRIGGAHANRLERELADAGNRQGRVAGRP